MPDYQFYALFYKRKRLNFDLAQRDKTDLTKGFKGQEAMNLLEEMNSYCTSRGATKTKL